MSDESGNETGDERVDVDGVGASARQVPAIVELCRIGIVFERELGEPLVITDGFDLAVSAGLLACIAGRSGSGKTSVLRVAAGLTTPTTGTVAWIGEDVSELGADALADLRRATVGIVDQRADLIEELSAIENVLLPAVPSRRARALLPWAKELLSRLGPANRVRHRPRALSGGERGRVCLARAMLLTPPLLIVDEPTASLDCTWADTVIEELRRYVAESDAAALVASHDPHLIAAADVVVQLESEAAVAS